MPFLTKSEYIDLISAGDAMADLCYNLGQKNIELTESIIEKLSDLCNDLDSVKDIVVDNVNDRKKQVEDEI